MSVKDVRSNDRLGPVLTVLKKAQQRDRRHRKASKDGVDFHPNDLDDASKRVQEAFQAALLNPLAILAYRTEFVADLAKFMATQSTIAQASSIIAYECLNGFKYPPAIENQMRREATGLAIEGVIDRLNISLKNAVYEFCSLELKFLPTDLQRLLDKLSALDKSARREIDEDPPKLYDESSLLGTDISKNPEERQEGSS